MYGYFSLCACIVTIATAVLSIGVVINTVAEDCDKHAS